MIALHDHSPGGRLAHLAMALCTFEGRASSAAFLVTSTNADLNFRFVDWRDSHWNSEDLQNKLGRDAALHSEFRATFPAVAELIASEVATFRLIFSGELLGSVTMQRRTEANGGNRGMKLNE